MIEKTIAIDKAIGRVTDGSTVMVGGFGVPGTPFALIDALIDTGVSNLTLIKNEANEDHMGLSKLIEAGRARKLITSHLGLNTTVIGMMNRGEIEVEFWRITSRRSAWVASGPSLSRPCGQMWH